jgi:glycosyltransferase involved in cell wall biosynthesis
MKILLLANHFNTGGITSYLTTLAGGLVKRGHAVMIASGDGECVADLEPLGVKHVVVGLHVKCELHPSVILSAFHLAALVKRDGYDVLHANTRSSQVCAALVSFMTGVPFVTTCHGFFKTRIGRRLFPLWGSGVLAISPQVRDHLVRDFYLHPERIHVVANGIDVEKFRPYNSEERHIARTRWGLPDGPVIGILARLSDVKGHEFLIRAMPAIMIDFPNVICAMFGVGPHALFLRDLVHELGLERNVTFFYAVNKAPQVIPLMDVIVVPSLQEGIGLSVIEAGACSVPVVASRVGGIPEVVLDGETGILVPPKDLQAIARAVSTLLGDPDRARAMGKHARQVVSGKFSAERMVIGTEAVYQSVVKKA